MVKKLLLRGNRFIKGHNYKGKIHSEEIRLKISLAGMGRKRTKQKIKLTYLEKKLCECGCGKEPKINRDTRKHNRFIVGHAGIGRVSWNRGKKQSEEHNLKIAKSHIGIKNSQETRLKLSLANQGKKLSEETKLKMSIAMIEHIEKTEFNGESFKARVGKNELSIITQIENAVDITGISNNRELFSKCGKWPDKFYEQYNLCLEVLEPHHFKANGELCDEDKKRELRIAWKLGCMIYYISEQEFLSNSDKEIHRFKDFLLLLKEGSN